MSIETILLICIFVFTVLMVYSIFMECKETEILFLIVTSVFICGWVFVHEENQPRFHEVSVPINGTIVNVQYIDTPDKRIDEERVRFLISLWAERRESAYEGAMEVVKDLNEFHELWADVYITQN